MLLVSETFLLSIDKSSTKSGIGQYFWRNASLAYLPPYLEDSVNLMHVTLFKFFQIKFLTEKSKNCASKVFDENTVIIRIYIIH